MTALLQKTSIWILSLVPFVYVSWKILPGHGLDLTNASGTALGYCAAIFILGACMARSWCTLRNIRDAENQAPIIGMNTLKPSAPMTQADIAERIAQGRVAEMSLHSAGMD